MPYLDKCQKISGHFIFLYVFHVCLLNLFRFLFAWFYLCAEGGNTDSMFDVEKAVGTIIIAKPLDAEQYSFYNLTLHATDGTNTAYTQVLNQTYFNVK